MMNGKMIAGAGALLLMLLGKKRQEQQVAPSEGESSPRGSRKPSRSSTSASPSISAPEKPKKKTPHKSPKDDAITAETRRMATELATRIKDQKWRLEQGKALYNEWLNAPTPAREIQIQQNKLFLNQQGINKLEDSIRDNEELLHNYASQLEKKAKPAPNKYDNEVYSKVMTDLRAKYKALSDKAVPIDDQMSELNAEIKELSEDIMELKAEGNNFIPDNSLYSAQRDYVELMEAEKALTQKQAELKTLKTKYADLLLQMKAVQAEYKKYKKLSGDTAPLES